MAFEASDLDHDGTLDKSEAEAFARGVHSMKNDGTEFDESVAQKAWEELSVADKITKDVLFARVYARALEQGKISDA